MSSLESTSSGRVDRNSPAVPVKALVIHWGLLAMPYLAALLVLAVLCHRYDLLTLCSAWVAEKQVPPSLHLFLLVPAAASAGLAVACVTGWRRRAAVAAGAALVAALIPFLPLQALYLFLVAPLLGLLAFWLRKLRDGTPMPPALVPGTILLFILALASFNRARMLQAMLLRPLDPDAMGYLQIARDNWWYDTHHREPGFVWLVQLLRLVTQADYSDPAGRLYSFLLAMATIAIVFGVVRHFFGLLVATVTGVLYAMNGELSLLATRLLREDLMIALFMIYAGYYLHTWGARPQARTYLVFGIIAIPCLLLRLNNNIFIFISMLIHFGWAAWKHRPPLRQVAWLGVGFVVAVAPVVPYLIYCQEKYGTPFYRSGREARFYANQELSGIHPDLPTREEFEKDSYVGGPMKMSTYLFRYHTLGQLWDGAWKGAGRLLGGDLARHAYRPALNVAEAPRPLIVLHFLGLAAYFLAARRRVLLGLFTLFHLPSLYLVQFLWFDPRLVTLAYVGYYIGCGLALSSLIYYGKRFVQAAGVTESTPASAPKAQARKKPARGK